MGRVGYALPSLCATITLYRRVRLLHRTHTAHHGAGTTPALRVGVRWKRWERS